MLSCDSNLAGVPEDCAVIYFVDLFSSRNALSLIPINIHVFIAWIASNAPHLLRLPYLRLLPCFVSFNPGSPTKVVHTVWFSRRPKMRKKAALFSILYPYAERRRSSYFPRFERDNQVVLLNNHQTLLIKILSVMVVSWYFSRISFPLCLWPYCRLYSQWACVGIAPQRSVCVHCPPVRLWTHLSKTGNRSSLLVWCSESHDWSRPW